MGQSTTFVLLKYITRTLGKKTSTIYVQKVKSQEKDRIFNSEKQQEEKIIFMFEEFFYLI